MSDEPQYQYVCGTDIDVGDTCYIAVRGDSKQTRSGPKVGTECEVTRIDPEGNCGPIRVTLRERSGSYGVGYSWWTLPEYLRYDCDPTALKKFGRFSEEDCEIEDECSQCGRVYGDHHGLDCPGADDNDDDSDNEDEDTDKEDEEEPTPVTVGSQWEFEVGDRVRFVSKGDYSGDGTGPAVGSVGVIDEIPGWNSAIGGYEAKWPGEQLVHVKLGAGHGFGGWFTNSGRLEPVAESEGSMATLKSEAGRPAVLSGEAPIIERRGRVLTLPEGMSNLEGIEWLKRREAEDKTKVAVRHEFAGCYPLDALVAVTRAMADIYNWVANVPTPGFFGAEPPTMFTVKTGPAPDEFVTVPFGSFAIPGLRGRLEVSLGGPKGKQPNLFLVGEVAQGDMEQVKGIIARAEERLVTSSIYRGKAIKVSWRWQREGEPYNLERDSPQFLDLTTVDPSDLVFSDTIQEAIEVGLYTPVEFHEACRRNGIPLKRGVLVEGPPGTGKTLLALVTALKAVAAGWTFVYLDDVRDLRLGLLLASQYAKAVVFAEDLDRVISGDRDADMDAVLNCLDGVDSKGQEILTIVTTNHVDSIIKPALRPGRIDMILSTRMPDAKAAARLVANYGRGLLHPGANLEKVGEALDGKIPAVIREVVERSKMAAIRRLGSDKIKGQVMGDDLLAAARSMERHAEMLAEDEQKPTRTTLEIPVTVIEERLPA